MSHLGLGGWLPRHPPRAGEESFMGLDRSVSPAWPKHNTPWYWPDPGEMLPIRFGAYAGHRWWRFRAWLHNCLMALAAKAGPP